MTNLDRVYSCHFFLLSSASVRSIFFCPVLCHLCMICSPGISNFLEEISSLSHSIVFLYFFALITVLQSMGSQRVGHDWVTFIFKIKVLSVKMEKPGVEQILENQKMWHLPHFTVTLKLKKTGFLFTGALAGQELHCHSICTTHLALNKLLCLLWCYNAFSLYLWSFRMLAFFHLAKVKFLIVLFHWLRKSPWKLQGHCSPNKSLWIRSCIGRES